ncbi:MatE domain-containing protein [Cephalotus follicularis]|uniref:Protein DETOXIFICATION n=1 Tax=Cephalotus follicularis TaxID=3775 RepID=A0A1Q3AP42_CEPFO|nr:MatE domain-containing protein [Cephalotus follicularis]
MGQEMEEGLIALEGQDTPTMKTRVWFESKKIWRIAFPSMLFRVSGFGLYLVTQSFIGHIGEVPLVAYALVQTMIIRFVNGVLLGMASATETLCGQSFGAKQYHMMGIYLQRSWIVNFVTATITVPALVFATPIFRLLGEEEDIAIEIGTISLWFIPFVYSLVFSMTIQMYLQAQLKNLVIGVLSTSAFVVHILLSWIFVSKLNWGLSGAMSALNISAWIPIFGGFVYIFGGWCPHTWKGFTKAAFTDLLPVVKISISSGAMLCLEVWYDAILVLVAGYMQNAEVSVSAFSICLNINLWEFMVSLGFLGAACVRVANELGRGNAEAAKFSIKVTLSTSVCIGVFVWTLCIAFGHEIGYAFSSNEEIAEYVSGLSVLLAFSMLLNSAETVLTGVAVGGGWQSVVAIVNLICYYVIGIPIGILLCYVGHLQAKGLWIGMLSGVVMQVIALTYITWRIDWNHEVNKASERLNQWLLKASEEPSEVNIDEVKW